MARDLFSFLKNFLLFSDTDPLNRITNNLRLFIRGMAKCTVANKNDIFSRSSAKIPILGHLSN